MIFLKIVELKYITQSNFRDLRGIQKGQTIRFDAVADCFDCFLLYQLLLRS